LIVEDSFLRRLSIGFWSKSGTSPDFGFEKARHTKIESSFQEKRSKKRNIKDFKQDILQKNGNVPLICAQIHRIFISDVNKAEELVFLNHIALNLLDTELWVSDIMNETEDFLDIVT
jgi:hypothetical protein